MAAQALVIIAVDEHQPLALSLEVAEQVAVALRVGRRQDDAVDLPLEQHLEQRPLLRGVLSDVAQQQAVALPAERRLDRRDDLHEK